MSQEKKEQAQKQDSPEIKGQAESPETPLEEIVKRLCLMRDARNTTDKVQAGQYRELEQQFEKRASPGQRARWKKIQNDPSFRYRLKPVEELVQYVIGKKELEFQLGDTKFVRWTKDGIFLVRNPGCKDENEEKVIAGHVEPLTRFLVDDEIYYRWYVDGREVTARLDDFLDQLHGEGAVLSKRNASDVLSAVATGMIQTTEKRYATYGIYPDDNKLVLCEDPFPVEDEQASAQEQVKEHVKREVKPEEVQAYIQILSYWHPYEVLPAFGAAFAAPFTPVLRQAHIFVPHIFQYGTESDLGKSAVALAVSLSLYGLPEISGESLESQFRLAAHLDSIALPLTVDEADRLDEKLLPIVKDSAERWIPAKRGTKERKMVRYHSRAVLIMTGNVLPTQNENVLKRILTVRFDSSAKRKRRKMAAEVRIALEALRPIGYAAIRTYVEAHPSRTYLLSMIRGFASEIEKEREEWESTQRPLAWAVIYFGLKVFEEFCEAFGVNWTAPSIETFVEQVVEPVERSTWESKKTVVECFSDWFDGWSVTHKRPIEKEGVITYDTVGRGDIWKEGTLEVNGETIEGVYITSAMLDLYNKQARPGERISNLKELALQAADAAGIPHEKVLEPKTGQVMRISFNNGQKRAAFVPYYIYTEPKKSCLFVYSIEPVSQKNVDNAQTIRQGFCLPSVVEQTKVDKDRQSFVYPNEVQASNTSLSCLDKKTKISSRARIDPSSSPAASNPNEHFPQEGLNEADTRTYLDTLGERTSLPEGDSSSTVQPDEGQEAIADSAKANQSEGPGNGANKLPEKGGTQL